MLLLAYSKMGKVLHYLILKQRRRKHLVKRALDVARALQMCALMMLSLSYYRDSIRTRCYLTKPVLVPIEHSPWRKLLLRGTDSHFITCMGLSRTAFFLLLQRYHPHFEDRPKGLGIRNMTYTSADSLGLVLHYLCSTLKQKHLQLLFGLPNVSRPLKYGLHKLLRTLKRDCPEARVKWPTHDEMKVWSEMIETKEDGQIKGIFGQ